MKLIVIDDHPLVRKGIISMLSDSKDIDEIKEATTIKEAVGIIEREKPDIAVVDLKLGTEDGLEIITNGKKLNLKTKYIILTSAISREEFLKAEKLGVDGYILKDAFAEDILYAINLVIRGKKYYHPEIIEYKNQRKKEDSFEQLTQREKDVLKELAKGLSNEEIGKQLYISENTVKKHVSNILCKLEFSHRTQLVAHINSKLTS